MSNPDVTTDSNDDDTPPLTMTAASRKLDELFKTRRSQKVFNALGATGIIIALVASVFLVKSHYELKNDESKLQQNAVASCQNGNSFRSGQTEIWSSFYSLQAKESKATSALLASLVSAIAQKNPAVIKQIDAILVKSNAAAQAEQKDFLAKVAQVNATRDCAAENTVTSSSAANG